MDSSREKSKFFYTSGQQYGRVKGAIMVGSKKKRRDSRYVVESRRENVIVKNQSD